ncbi:MAG: hypothetical protein IPK01_08405 [Acidobacteria bacterium]|nr:hypothetical protein [Acidobacteriota bacterium]
MLKPLQILVFFLLISVLCGAGFAQGSTIIPAIPGSQIFPLSQVKEGLKGTARTVFRGTAPEEFGVEILGVIPGSIGPHQDMIIGN